MPLVRRLGSCTPAWPPAVRLWFGGRLLAEQDEVTVSARPSGRLLTCVVSTRRRARDGPHPASSFRSILDNSGSRSPARRPPVPVGRGPQLLAARLRQSLSQ